MRDYLAAKLPQTKALFVQGCGGDAMQFLRASAQPIESPGAALMRWRVGRGQIILSTIDMEKGGRLYDQLLLNLGAAAGDLWPPSSDTQEAPAAATPN